MTRLHQSAGMTWRTANGLEHVSVNERLLPINNFRHKRRHPAVEAHLAKTAGDWQLRLADLITRFAGSMLFVYLHMFGFGAWMLFAERSPWPTLTLIVSLEAIFLTTFVMIGQNRAAAFQQAKADHDFQSQTLELQANTATTNAIHALTEEIHRHVVTDGTPNDAHS